MNKKYPKQFKRVSDYLKEKFEIDVLLGQITAFMGHKNKKIFIHHNHNLEKNGLYSLLHELGHVLQDEKDNFFKTIDEDKQPNKFKYFENKETELMYKFKEIINSVEEKRIVKLD